MEFSDAAGFLGTIADGVYAKRKPGFSIIVR